MSVSRLKDFLSERNVPTTGKRRNELETLARKAANVYPMREECDHAHAESERERRRVRTADGSFHDLNGRVVKWTKDFKKILFVRL